jgi:hypothetical protein
MNRAKKIFSRKSRGRQRLNPWPGPYKANPIFVKKFRYQAQSSESKDQDYVTMASLQALMLVGSTNNSSGLGFFSAIRLKSVEMWADSSSSNSLTTIGLDWLSPDSPNTQVNSTGNSFHPAHFKTSPPRESAASRWYAGQLLAQNTPTSIVSTTPYAFSLISTVSGAIVEITLEFTIFDQDSLNNPQSFSSATITAGQVYYNQHLDNTSVSLGAGTRNWVVQGISNSAVAFTSSW